MKDKKNKNSIKMLTENEVVVVAGAAFTDIPCEVKGMISGVLLSVFTWGFIKHVTFINKCSWRIRAENDSVV